MKNYAEEERLMSQHRVPKELAWSSYKAQLDQQLM